MFTINNETYEFSNMVVAWNDELYQWKFVVDTKPFDKETIWSVTNWKKIKAIYSLDYGNGKQVTSIAIKRSIGIETEPNRILAFILCSRH